MSNNCLRSDNCTYKQNLQQSTKPVSYILDTPCDDYRKKNSSHLINKDNSIRGLNCIKEYDVNKNKAFNNPTGIYDDKCFISGENKQNMNQGVYILSNYHQCACTAPQVASVALREPTINYRDGYGHTSMDGCNIDSDSLMRNGSLLTNTKCINQLDVPSFPSIPYMGRGRGNPCIEGQLIAGEDTSQKKPCNILNKRNTIEPLIPCLKDNIQNPQHIIQQDVSNNWIRGGIPSRQMKQNANILRKCKFKTNM